MIKSFINNYFGFNKQQRNGLMVLVIISFTLLVARLAVPLFITPDEIVIKNIPLDSKFNPDTYRDQDSKDATELNSQEEKLFAFDPNRVGYEELIQLGFTGKTAQTFLKFRSKGFVFKEKADLKKIYGVTDNFYVKLEPYIHFETMENIRAKKSGKISLVKDIQAAKLELNIADSSALVTLDGIGPSYASRIIKYRSMLGGFISMEQLKEVYGFTDELFKKVKDRTTVDASLIKKIDLNKDDFKTINKHPYISYEQTKSIFDWRRKTTITPANLKDILNDSSLYERLLPYLNF
jgi:competence protein ComEA